MNQLRKLALVACLLAFSACASGRNETPPGAMGPVEGKAEPEDCSTAGCRACPPGQTAALQAPDCCRCIPVGTAPEDCSNVRCEACPTGQRPALTPPECCRCVPDEEGS